jgi:hypothetical protein
MAKVRIICVVCGFVGFIDSLALATDCGWSLVSRTRTQGVCPACLKDQELPSTPDAEKPEPTVG